MALAAFASVFMGNSLEGGLLLAMFNLAHIGKYFKQTPSTIVFLNEKIFLLFIYIHFFILLLTLFLFNMYWHCS